MKRLIFWTLFLIVPVLVSVYPAKIAVFTANNIVQLVKDRASKIKTFTGSFVYVYNNKSSWGLIRFKSPNKFLMSYMDKNSSGQAYETGQKFVSDGKVLWLVFKNQNIAINETLERDPKTPLVGWNINRLQKEYIATLPKTGYKVKYGKIDALKLVFLPKSNTAGFKYINMIINEDGDILKVEAMNQVGVTVELGITYESFNQNISEENFEYEPDENTQIYENILLPRNQNDNDK